MRYWITLMAVLGGIPAAAPAETTADPSTLAGLAGAELLDAGTMTAGAGGPWARQEVFELLRLGDGRHVLLNTITADGGAYRVRARFDMDAAFNMTAAHGIGLYDDVPVRISMQRTDADRVAIRVDGDGVTLSPTVTCDADCLINMSPSMTAMYVMTRHYDHEAGGEQRFDWISQDLDRQHTMVGGRADMSYRGTVPVTRAGGERMQIRHYTFVERLPGANGIPFVIDFDLWTDDAERPMGFHIVFRDGQPPVTGFRTGFEDVRDALMARRAD